MKNKVFNVWIKELASIVFTQSLQALVLAVLMSVVVGLFVSSKNDTTSGNSSTNYSIGVYAIIAMASLSKIELLVKRIFGIGPSSADISMAGGKKSLLKTGVALKLGGRVLNNVPKVASGVGGLLIGQGAARRRVRNAQKDYDDYKAKVEEEKKKQKDEFKKFKKGGQFKRGTQFERGNTQVKKVGSTPLTAESLADALKNSDKKNPKKELNEAKAALSKERRENLSKITSGTLETFGAAGGGVVGAGIGLAMGEDIASNAMIGAGIGDKLGEVANTPMSLYDYAASAHEAKRSEMKSKDEIKAVQEKYQNKQNRLIKKEENKQNKIENKKQKEAQKQVKKVQKEETKQINKERQAQEKTQQNKSEQLKNQNKRRRETTKRISSLKGPITPGGTSKSFKGSRPIQKK